MSISDKLIAIAENEEKVFDAGKRALLRASKYMNATARGTVIAVNDVSPIEHDVTVQLSGESVTDFSSVTVKRYGKNLLGFNEFSQLNPSKSYVDAFDGEVFTKTVSTNQSTSWLIAEAMTPLYIKETVLLPGDYVFSFQQIGGTVLIKNAYAVVTLEDGTTERLRNGIATTLTQKATITELRSAAAVYSAGDFIQYVLQLERGRTVTDYEPYSEPTSHAVSAEGVVEGVRNLSPTMILVADTDGVTIDCSFLRDIDRYIDGLTGGVATWEVES